MVLNGNGSRVSGRRRKAKPCDGCDDEALGLKEIRPGRDGYSTEGLRSDARQWLIYDDEAMGAVMRAVEVACLTMAGRVMARNPAIAVRAIGNFATRVAQARGAEMIRRGGVQAMAISHVSKILSWIAAPTLGEPPAEEMDEIQATVIQLDHRARVAGVGAAKGAHRIAVRGD